MAEARNRQLWDHTAELLAMLGNGLLMPKTPFTGQQLHPYRRPRQRAEHVAGIDGPEEGWAALRAALKKCKRRVVKAAAVRVARGD